MAGNFQSRGRGVDLAIHQRVLRLAAMGQSHPTIAYLVGIDPTAVRRLARRTLSPKWRRCECGAMTDRWPCLACTLRAARAAAGRIDQPIGTR
ncbi:MAG: hypothetical protein U0805_20920 [Pirellulales bacterium]